MRNSKEYDRIFADQCRLQDEIKSALVEKLYNATREIERLENEVKLLKAQVNSGVEAY